MKRNNKNTNVNNFNGQMNFNGSTQIAAGDIINNMYANEDDYKNATYRAEPVWRSPFTLGVLTWISVALGIISFLPISKIFGNILDILKGNLLETSSSSMQIYSIFFAIVMFLFIIFVSLRSITKKQIRKPLKMNYSISGYNGRITLEKIHIDKCPMCGGEMKYYNKAVEWIDKHYSDGKTKREVTKRIPVLECKRNGKHCFEVDPAEDRVD